MRSWREFCWGDPYFLKEGARCPLPIVTDFGLCLSCYIRLVGRLPKGFREEDLEDHIREREGVKESAKFAIRLTPTVKMRHKQKARP